MLYSMGFVHPAQVGENEKKTFFVYVDKNIKKYSRLISSISL